MCRVINNRITNEPAWSRVSERRVSLDLSQSHRPVIIHFFFPPSQLKQILSIIYGVIILVATLINIYFVIVMLLWQS